MQGETKVIDYLNRILGNENRARLVFLKQHSACK